MKEFLFKHPIVTLLLGSSAIKGIVTVVKIIAYSVTKDPVVMVAGGGTITTTHKEDNQDEPANDIQ